MSVLEDYQKLSEEMGSSNIGLAARWIMYHSASNGECGDKVIFGARTAEQLGETLMELGKGPLEREEVEKLDAFWRRVQGDAFADNAAAVGELVMRIMESVQNPFRTWKMGV
jgi:aflatoxin B1 aldehyde reductase